MKRIIYSAIIAVFTFSCVIAQQGKRFHTIQQGENLYQLTKIYNVTAEAICEANPGLNVKNFKIGAVVLIPSSSSQIIEVTQVVDSLVNFQQTQGIAGSICKEMHKVQKKETLFSISQKYGITIDELKEANPEIKKNDFVLKKKMVLCIPEHKEIQAKPQEIIPSNEQLFSQANKSEGLSLIRVGVILPMKGDNATNKSCLEFYRGILMAVDEMKREGTSFEVYAYDSSNKSGDIDRILTRPMMENLDLIIGPAEYQQIMQVSRFSKNHNILMVSPFNSKSGDVYDNPNLFILNAPDSVQFSEVEFLAANTFKGYNVVIVDTQVQPADDILPYIKGISDDIRYIQFPMTESALQSRLVADKENLIVLSTSDAKSLNTILPILKNIIQNNPETKLSFLGYPNYLAYLSSSELLHEEFYKFNTFIFSSFYLDIKTPVYKEFERQYNQNYKMDMLQGTPRMAVYGYDCGRYFFEGLKREGKSFSGYCKPDGSMLQNRFRMERVNNWGGVLNHQMQLIHFDRNNKVEILEKNQTDGE